MDEKLLFNILVFFYFFFGGKGMMMNLKSWNYIYRGAPPEIGSRGSKIKEIRFKGGKNKVRSKIWLIGSIISLQNSRL